MDLIKGFIIIIFVIGIVLLTIYFMAKSEVSKCDKKIIYKYLPRTLEEEETESWEDLDPALKASINRGIKQSDAKEGTAHTKVMAGFRKKYLKK